jgi:FixJ family two-component response regulator
LNTTAQAICPEKTLMDGRSLIVVVDDDASVRESLPDLLTVLGHDARAFASAEDFLASAIVDQTCCLILDVAMPGMTGPELQGELLARRRMIPIVFITAHADESLRRQLVKRGAVACLFKPFAEPALLAALAVALRAG